MADHPLVSVIIPTYNRRDLVARAIESACTQTYSNVEVIVIDDGSTDGTGDAVQRLGYDVTYLYQSNRGLAAARNAAIKSSRGELVALLDSDDWWLGTKLERCVGYLQAHRNVDVVYTPMLTVDSRGNPMQGHDKKCLQGRLLDELFENVFIHDPAAVFQRTVWEHVGGFDESLPVCVGHNFWLRVAVDHTFGLIDEPLAVRTWLKDSLTRGDRIRGHRSKIDMLTRFYNEHPGRRKLSPERARRSLARAYYSAGKACLSGGDVPLAVRYLREAIRYRPKWGKARFFYVLALGRSQFRRAA